MMNQFKNIQFWQGVPPWLLIGAVVVLLPLFAFMTLTSINRQKAKSTQLLLEKGAALIRSFEAGTRAGMMGMNRGGFQLQQLLTETARQPDIVHLLVADIEGEIIAHNNLQLVGASYAYNVDLKKISDSKDLHWQVIDYPDGIRVFEVYRRFTPTKRPRGWMHGGRIMHRRMQKFSHERGGFNPQPDDRPKIIFVGLDMTAVEEAHRADIRHAIFMGIILLLVGFAGIILLFLFHSYRAARVSLSRIKAFSDNVVENMPIGLIALDNRRRIAAFNHTAESLMRLSLQDVIGKTADKVLPAELCGELNCTDINSQVIEKEIDCTIGNGHTISLEISASRLTDESGTHLGHVILFKDLTEIRSLRLEIERSRRLASVGRLAAGVAHEIRNPLSSIKGFATYFKQRYADVPEDQQTAGIMIQEVDRLNRVVTQLLEFARPVGITLKPTSTRELVADFVKFIQPQAADKKIAVMTHHSEKAEPVNLDPDGINQVFLNLCINGLEAMEPGGELRIEISGETENGGLVIQISDNGSGIDEKDLPKIFDPYFTTRPSGTGLGLAIVHNIIEAMGGTIKVESEVGVGTTFRIRLPIELQK
jgi:two-component system sensor histidine kinase HydH